MSSLVDFLKDDAASRRNREVLKDWLNWKIQQTQASSPSLRVREESLKRSGGSMACILQITWILPKKHGCQSEDDE